MSESTSTSVQDVHIAARIRPMLERDATAAATQPNSIIPHGLRVYRDGSIGVLQQPSPQQQSDAIVVPTPQDATFSFDYIFDNAKHSSSSSLAGGGGGGGAVVSSSSFSSAPPSASSFALPLSAVAAAELGNAHLVDTLLLPMRDTVAQGLNIAVIAYGAREGKTHTILGQTRSPMPRVWRRSLVS